MKKTIYNSVPFYKRINFWLLTATVVISVVATIFSYAAGNQNLADYDAIARLNIARKVFDSLTPGVAQLGGIWLPFPQILFMPFIWSKFLWHTGLAGTIVSMFSFVVTAYFLYKTVVLVTGKKIGGLLAWLVYVTNINILFLQTSSMSEPFFLLTLVMIIYFLTKWTKTKHMLDLVSAGVFVILATLTRYEGYAIFGASVLTVGAVTLKTYGWKSLKRLEGILVLFVTLSGFGIFVWSLYSLLIFKDPIYWLNLYAGNKEIVALDPTEVTKVVDSLTSVSGTVRKTTLASAVAIYGSSMLFMNGVLVTLSGLGAFLYLLIKSSVDFFRKRMQVVLFPILIVAFSILVFLLVGYAKHLIPEIQTPYFSLQTILSKANNFVPGANIRYGLIVLPLIAVIIGIVFSKFKPLAIAAFVVIIFQTYTLLGTPLFLTYSLFRKESYKEFPVSVWFRNNYDGGLVMTSANRHENFILQTGLPYKDFIYEGSQNYWRQSIADPSLFARWVVVDYSDPGDAINTLMADRTILKNRFAVVFQEGELMVYKRK